MKTLLLILMLTSPGCVAEGVDETRMDRESERVPDTVLNEETDSDGSRSVQASPCHCDQKIPFYKTAAWELLQSDVMYLNEKLKALEAENARVKAENEYSLYLFGASWCGPCTTLKKTLDAAGIPYEYVDTDKDFWFVQNGFNSIPTLMLKKGDEFQKTRYLIGPQNAATVRQRFPEVFE